MTLVSHDHKFIFLKTVKTAGTSVEMVFEPFCRAEGEPVTEATPESISTHGIVGARLDARTPNDVWYNHMTASEVRGLLGEETWNSYLKFCTVRNPYTTVLSLYCYHFKKAYPTSPDEFAEFKAGFRSFVMGAPIRRIVKSSGLLAPVRRQLPGTVFEKRLSNKVIPFIGNKNQMDRVIHYENLADDTQAVADELGLGDRVKKLPKTKITSGRTTSAVPSAFFDPDMARIVRADYWWAFELGGYDLEVPNQW